MVNKIEETLNYFYEHPEAIRRSANETAKRRNCTPMEVCKAKEMFRAGIKTEPIGKPKARILLLDIETAPMKAYVWGRWKQNISLSQTISEWFMLSWSAKWLGEEDVMSAVLTPDEALAENDERIVYRMWQLLNEAHVVVGHNCVRFDMPKIQSRFIVHGFPPCTPYKQIDTLKVAKQQFGFSSNKLDALATYFGVENKINTSFELWQGCLDGDQESLLYMEEYNKMDVLILEKVYLRLRPYIKSHINIGLLEDKAGVCPHCGSEDLNPIDGEFMFNNTTVSELYRCSSCGAVARGAKNKYPKTFRSSLIRSC